MRIDTLRFVTGMAILSGYVILLIMLLHSCASSAHDHDRPELNKWFKSLQSGKGPCCNNTEAIHVDDPDWQNDSGHYRVRLEGEWVDVPDDAVVSGPNMDGRAMVWPYRRDGVLNQIRCFMPGAQG
jgi:hypothetical protein